MGEVMPELSEEKKPIEAENARGSMSSLFQSVWEPSNEEFSRWENLAREENEESDEPKEYAPLTLDGVSAWQTLETELSSKKR